MLILQKNILLDGSGQTILFWRVHATFSGTAGYPSACNENGHSFVAFTLYYRLPLQVLCTRKKAKVTLACMFFVCSAVSSFSFATIGTVQNVNKNNVNVTDVRCLIYRESRRFYRDWLAIFFGLGELLIPSIAVAFFTGIIIWKLSVAAKERSKTIGHQTRASRASKESQPTMALLSIAITFVLLRLPYIVAYYINEYKVELWKDITLKSKFQIYIAYSFTFVLSTLTYSISFLLFCLTGQTFRKELRRCICRFRGSAHPRSAYANTYTTRTSVKFDTNSGENCKSTTDKSNVQLLCKKSHPKDL